MRAKSLLFPFLACVSLLAASVPALAIGEDEFLTPEQAFTYTASADSTQVTVEWKATPGYYLYKKRMGLAAATPGVTVGEPVYPKGEIHKDDYFGEQEVFRGAFKVTAPLSGAKPGDTIALKLKWQGCADAGLCYPPSVWDATVKVAAATTADKVFAKVEAAQETEEEFLDPEVAFVVTSEALSTSTVRINWRIADGYYLYKQRISLEPTDVARPVGALVLPKGEAHHDEYFGEQEVYRSSLDGTFSVPPGAKSVDVKVSYQGCADAGLCYPPITKVLSVSLEGAPASPVNAAATTTSGGYESEQDSWTRRIAQWPLYLVLLSAFAAGLGLAFTPCVLPMVPILSGIIAGGGANTSTLRSFMLSVSYVLGMALTYTGAGVAAAAIGNGLNLNATFNQPWIIMVFSGLFVVLAASMFGFFTIEMPSFIQTRISEMSGKQQAGTFVGVGVMGMLSALIVSACVAPPIIGVLTYISQTGNIARGAGVLFIMTIGMGTPLLVVGASGGKLLPRAGAWMETVKNIFGVLFLAVAVWMLSRILPGWAAMILWAVPAFALAWILWRAYFKSPPMRYLAQAVSVIAGLYAVALLVGAALGGTNPLAPIPQLAGKVEHLPFKRFKTVADLEREVAAASAAGKPVMVDFFADWCVSCIEMEHKSFSEPEVRAALENFVLLQADVTANDEEDRKLYVHFGIVGPPTIAFYGVDGVERRNFRVVGYMKAAEFAAVVRQAVAPATPPKT